jgi:hypothetical protein
MRNVCSADGYIDSHDLVSGYLVTLQTEKSFHRFMREWELLPLYRITSF